MQGRECFSFSSGAKYFSVHMSFFSVTEQTQVENNGVNGHVVFSEPVYGMHNKWAQNKYIPFFAYIPLAVYAKTALARLNLYYFHFFVPVNGVEGKHFEMSV